MKLRSYSKINLFLHINGKRADGFHELTTVFAAISLYDNLILEEIPCGIKIDCEDPSVPKDKGNLIYQAAELIQKETNLQKGVHFILKKQVPPGSGLGAGSSNGAAALWGLNKLWNANLPEETLLQLATKMGSDVPFFLRGGFCKATGRGEILTPIQADSTIWLVLVRPEGFVSTPKAYTAFDSLDILPEGKDLSILLDALKQGSKEVAASLRNDLEAAVLPQHPEIQKAKKDLLDAGALGVLMSGSGSAVFGIAKDEAHAEVICGRLTALHPWVHVAHTIGSAIEME